MIKAHIEVALGIGGLGLPVTDDIHGLDVLRAVIGFTGNGEIDVARRCGGFT